MRLRTSSGNLWLPLLLLFTSCSANDQPSQPAEPPALVIDGARIWDGTGTPPVPDGVLVIKGERIEAVGPRGSVTIPDGASIVDAKGKTAIPGIINVHGHVGLTKGLVQSKNNYSRDSMLANLRQYAQYGVTTVWSLGLDSEAVADVRGPAKNGEPPRATMFIAGRGFTGKAGYPTMLPGLGGIPVEVDTREEIQAHIRELAQQKVDIVKVWVDDHFGRYPKIRPELYKAIIEEAHRQNLRVIAHLFYLSDAKALVEAGLDGIAHSIRDRDVDDDLIRMLKEKNTFYISTLARDHSTFFYAEPPAFLDDPFFTRSVEPDVIKTLKDPSWGAKVKSDPDFSKFATAYETGKRNLKKLFEAGVNIAFGSDTGPPGRFHGFFDHLELEQMVEAGLTPAQALQIATLGSARHVGIERDFGSLEKGKRADLVLLDADPLEAVSNTRKISRVWIGGREVN